LIEPYLGTVEQSHGTTIFAQENLSMMGIIYPPGAERTTYSLVAVAKLPAFSKTFLSLQERSAPRPYHLPVPRT